MLRVCKSTLLCLSIAAIQASLLGCAAVGPSTIHQGRGLYNQVIADTSAQQTMLNIVRTHFGEFPQFLEIDGIAAAATSQLTLGGTESQLGSFTNPTMATGARLVSGAVGQIMSGGQINELPTITMKPIAGAALISQIASPITAESIVNLYNSGNYIGSIFDLTVTRFTPAFDDYHAALNAIMALDRYGNLILEARTPSELVIYYQRERPRERFLSCDAVSGKVNSTTVTDNLWKRLQQIFRQSGSAIVLEISSTMPSGSSKLPDVAHRDPSAPTPRRVGSPPLLRTRSALGMLNFMASGDNLVVFDIKEGIETIIQRNASDQRSRCHVSFYDVGPAAPAPDATVLNRNNEKLTVDNGQERGVLDTEGLRSEQNVADERRLILIETSTSPPVDAYVSVQHNGVWYSIRSDDVISKRNFSLVTQINTIQALPTALAAPIQTINVGARP